MAWFQIHFSHDERRQNDESRRCPNTHEPGCVYKALVNESKMIPDIFACCWGFSEVFWMRIYCTSHLLLRLWKSPSTSGTDWESTCTRRTIQRCTASSNPTSRDSCTAWHVIASWIQTTWAPSTVHTITPFVFVHLELCSLFISHSFLDCIENNL